MNYILKIKQQFPTNKFWTFGPFDNIEEVFESMVTHCQVVADHVVGAKNVSLEYEPNTFDILCKIVCSENKQFNSIDFIECDIIYLTKQGIGDISKQEKTFLPIRELYTDYIPKKIDKRLEN